MMMIMAAIFFNLLFLNFIRVIGSESFPYMIVREELEAAVGSDDLVIADMSMCIYIKNHLTEFCILG